MGMTAPQWVDQYIREQVPGKNPHDKLKKSFTVHAFRSWLKAKGHPGWANASMMLQQHKYAQRWGSTDFMIRCDSKGPDARWIVSNWEDTTVAMETKIDQLSREHINDLLCRAKRFAEGNTGKPGGAFDGDTATLEGLKRETEIIVGQWNVMRSVVYHLKPVDFAKSWNAKYVVIN